MTTVRSKVALVLVLVLMSGSGCGGDEDAVPLAWDSPAPIATRTATSSPAPTGTATMVPTATPLPPPSYASTRITWQGRDWYLHGANLPWVNWGCDFGCGAQGGASSPLVGQVVSTVMQAAKPAGLNVIRWWMFPGEPDQFVVSADGATNAIRPEVFRDIDAALELARTNDVYFVFVLFSAPSHLPHGWTTDESQRLQLASVVGELAGRYRQEPRILAWEVFNEPEWDIWGGLASQNDVVATVDAITAEIHENSNALVTVGSATIEGLVFWLDSDLDFYSPHWYDPMSHAACARCTDYARLQAKFGIDKPVIVGEFFADSTVDSAQRYADFYDRGFAGAWAWSLLPDRTEDGLSVDLDASEQFASGREDVGPTTQ